MGMRQKASMRNTNTAVRVLPTGKGRGQELTFNKKKLILPIVLLLIVIALGIFAIVLAVSKKNTEELLAQQAAQAPADNYVNILYEVFETMPGYYFEGTVNGITLSSLLEDSASLRSQPYTNYYIVGEVGSQEIRCNLYGMLNDTEKQYITTFISNEDGFYSEISNYYLTDTSLTDFKLAEEYFKYLMRNSVYIRNEPTQLSNGYLLNQYIMNVLKKMAESEGTEIAQSDNSYSVRTPQAVMTSETPNILSKITEINKESIVSNLVVENAAPKREVTLDIQQGNMIIHLLLTENPAPQKKTTVYAMTYEWLQNAMKSLVKIKDAYVTAEKKEAEEKAKQQAEQELENNKAQENDANAASTESTETTSEAGAETPAE